MTKFGWSLAAAALLMLSGREKPGTLEQAGEEVDEAADTLAHGGNESIGNKVDDAVDRARDEAAESRD